MKTSLIATLLLSAALPGLAQTMFRGGPAHGGVYAAEGPRQFHRVKWTFPTGNRVVSSPVMQGNVVYLGSDDANVYAADARDGRQIWKYTTRGAVSASPAVSGETVYVGSYDGHFYALN